METSSSEEGDKTAALFFVLPWSNKSMGAPAHPMPTAAEESSGSLFLFVQWFLPYVHRKRFN